MSVISLSCPGCQQPMEAPAEMAGQVAQCPACSQEISIPQAVSDAGVVPATAPTGNACAECGAAMEPDSVLCVECGFHSGLGKKIDTDL
jgi:hypothetical protein